VPVQTNPARTRTAQASTAQASTAQASTVQIATESGAALAELDGDGTAARFLLVLTHGAGGSAGAPDLLAVRDAARPLGGLVARVTQPYRVRGARAPGSPVRQESSKPRETRNRPASLNQHQERTQ